MVKCSNCNGERVIVAIVYDKYHDETSDIRDVGTYCLDCRIMCDIEIY